MSVNLDEIDDFVRRAEDVERQVKALLDPSAAVKPSDAAQAEADSDQSGSGADSGAGSGVRARGGRSSKSAAEEEEERLRDRARAARWAAQAAEKEEREERERWWRLAFYSKERDIPDPDDAEGAASTSASAGAGSSGSGGKAAAGAEKERPPAPRYTGPNYAKWEAWLKNPDDPASQEEMKRAADEREAAQNEAFEKANPDFVASFKADQAKRAAGDADKAKRADALRSAGNEAFKAGQHKKALGQYGEALALTPLSEPLLTNIAATHAALGSAAVAEAAKAAAALAALTTATGSASSAATATAAAAAAPDGTPAAASAVAASASLRRSEALRRAARHLGLAFEYATRAAWLNPRSTKALWRRAQACIALDSLSLDPMPLLADGTGAAKPKLPNAAASPSPVAAVFDAAGLLRHASAEAVEADAAASSAAASSSALVLVPAGVIRPEDEREAKAARKQRLRGAALLQAGWTDAGLKPLLLAAGIRPVMPAAASAGAVPAPGSVLRLSLTDAADADASSGSDGNARTFTWLQQAEADLAAAAAAAPASGAAPAAGGAGSEVLDALGRVRTELREREREAALRASAAAVAGAAAAAAEGGAAAGGAGEADAASASASASASAAMSPIALIARLMEQASSVGALAGAGDSSVLPAPAAAAKAGPSTAKAAAAGAGSSLAMPAGLGLLSWSGDDLRSLSRALAVDDDSVVDASTSPVALALQLRTRGVLAALIAAVRDTAAFVRSHTEPAAPAVPALSVSSRFLLHPAALGPALALLAGAVRVNAKNRLLAVDGGVVQAACAALSLVAATLSAEEAAQAADSARKAGKAPGKSAAATAAASSPLPLRAAIDSLFSLPLASSASASASSSSPAVPAPLTFSLFLPPLAADAASLLDTLVRCGLRPEATSGAVAAGAGSAASRSDAGSDADGACARSRRLLVAFPRFVDTAAPTLLAVAASTLRSYNEAVKAAALRGAAAVPGDRAPRFPSALVEAAAGCAAVLQHLALDAEQEVVRASLAATSTSIPSAAPTAPTGPVPAGLIPSLMSFLDALVAESGAIVLAAMQRASAAAAGESRATASRSAKRAVGSSAAAGGAQSVDQRAEALLAAAEPAALAAMTRYPVQVVSGALANLAQIEALRPAFVLARPGDVIGQHHAASGPAAGMGGMGGTGGSPAAAGPLAPLLFLLALPPLDGVAASSASASSSSSFSSSSSVSAAAASAHAAEVAIVRGSAIAALANASLGVPAVVDALTAAPGTLQLLLALLPLPTAASATDTGRGASPVVLPTAAMPLEVASRAALLLARVSSHPTITASLAQPSTLAGLAALLSACCTLRSRILAGAAGAAEATAVAPAELPAGSAPAAVADALTALLGQLWLPEGAGTGSAAASASASASASATALATLQDAIVRVLAAAVTAAPASGALASSSAPGGSPPAAGSVDAFVLGGGLAAVSAVVADILADNDHRPALSGMAAGSAGLTAGVSASSRPKMLAAAGPSRIQRAAALGNACKLGITLATAVSAAAVPAAAGSGSGSKAGGPVASGAKLLSSGTVDWLVEALRVTSDAHASDAHAITARKNAAVALARLARDPACGERIRELRGMEMLMAIGNNIVK